MVGLGFALGRTGNGNFPGNEQKNRKREDREMETEIEFGNRVGIFVYKTRTRLSDKHLNNLVFLKKHFWHVVIMDIHGKATY